MIYTSKKIVFPAIPAHKPLLTENITVSSVMENLPTYANMKDIVKMPEISASIARLYESFATISKIKEFQQNKAKSNSDVFSKLFTSCYAQQNPIIDFIDFTSVSVLREENYCQNSRYASFDECMNKLFRKDQSEPSDLRVSFVKPKMSPDYDEDIKTFIKEFYFRLEEMIKEYKMNEQQFNRARNPDISRWNHFWFGTFSIIFSISAYNLHLNGQKSIEESKDRQQIANKKIQDILDFQKKMKGIHGY